MLKMPCLSIRQKYLKGWPFYFGVSYSFCAWEESNRTQLMQNNDQFCLIIAQPW